MKKYVGLSAALLCFGFVAFAENQTVKMSPGVINPGEAVNGGSQCDGVDGNLVANCGFETGAFAPEWTQSGDLSATFVDPVSAHSGRFGAALGPVTDQGLLTQILPTKAGGTYTLSLWLRHDGGLPNNFYIIWDGAFVDGFVDSVAFPYMQLVYDGLVASADGTELTFSFYQVPAWYRLDDIVVVPSP